MVKRLQEIHPGEILSEEFLKPLKITGRRLSSDIDVPASRISEILNGHRPITADTALRLGIYFWLIRCIRYLRLQVRGVGCFWVS